ncbi:MAG: Flp pilus assembly complex ATPase component TadA [Chloroflexi bacterium]|nr:Flp pilus assembly complex ATPase component TadA [Chloroflexota bacterium]
MPSDPGRGTTRRDLGEVLLDAGLITPEQLEAAQQARQEGQSITDVLIAQGTITPRDVAMALSLQLNLPLIDLKRHTVQPHALALVPEEIARRYNVTPLDVIDGELLVVMENPLDIQALEDISIGAGMRVRPAVGTRDDIQGAHLLYYRARGEIERQLERIAPEPTSAPEAPRLTAEMVAQNPVARVVELLLSQATRDRASDVHIAPDNGVLRVRYRIDGILHDALEAPMSVHGPLISRIKVMAAMNIAERRRPQDGQFIFQGQRGEVDVRVATADTARGEMAVLRLLDKSVSLLRLEELGFLSEAMTAYEQLCTLPFGMMLVAGPTGAGKTTTLYATINRLDRDENNIMTIEDPVEYQFERINQIQVNRQASITFAVGLRAIMRLDPNVILVGEIRDREAADTAVQAALTGHLVLSSIHANDGVGALYRLVDLGVEPFLVVSALAGVVAQRLVRKVCDHCRTLADVSLAERLAFESEMGNAPDRFYQGQGCNFCADTGYRGRVGVFEVLTVSEPIRHLLLKGAGADEIKAQAIADGMVTMRRDGMLKVQQGITTPREVMRNVYTIR